MKNYKIIFLFLSIINFYTYPRVQVIFNRKIHPNILNLIKLENESIDAAWYTFTDLLIAKALIDAHNRGVVVRCVVDQYTTSIDSGKAFFLRQHGIDVAQYVPRGSRSLMHHKFISLGSNGYFNQSSNEKEALVVTGSYNPTGNASSVNCENIIVSNNGELVDEYEEGFNQLMRNSIQIPIDLAMARDRKNPANADIISKPEYKKKK